MNRTSYLRRCVVLDASALQGGKPGPRSVCNESDVTAWMALLHVVRVKCWVLVIPSEAQQEVENRLRKLLSGCFLSMLLTELYRLGKLVKEVSGAEKDEAYIMLAKQLADANRCSRILVVTCDREMYERATRVFRGYTTVKPTTPTQHLTS